MGRGAVVGCGCRAARTMGGCAVMAARRRVKGGGVVGRNEAAAAVTAVGQKKVLRRRSRVDKGAVQVVRFGPLDRISFLAPDHQGN